MRSARIGELGARARRDRSRAEPARRPDRAFASEDRDGRPGHAFRFVDVAVPASTRASSSRTRPPSKSDVSPASPVPRAQISAVRRCCDAHAQSLDGRTRSRSPVRRASPFPPPTAQFVSPSWSRSAVAEEDARTPYRILVSEIMSATDAESTACCPVPPSRSRSYPDATGAARRGTQSGKSNATWYPLGCDVRPRRLRTIARESVSRVRRPNCPADRGNASLVQGDRRMHGRGHSRLRVSRAGGHPRHERGPRPLSSVRGRTEIPSATR